MPLDEESRPEKRRSGRKRRGKAGQVSCEEEELLLQGPVSRRSIPWLELYSIGEVEHGPRAEASS